MKPPKPPRPGPCSPQPACVNDHPVVTADFQSAATRPGSGVTAPRKQPAHSATKPVFETLRSVRRASPVRAAGPRVPCGAAAGEFGPHPNKRERETSPNGARSSVFPYFCVPCADLRADADASEPEPTRRKRRAPYARPHGSPRPWWPRAEAVVVDRASLRTADAGRGRARARALRRGRSPPARARAPPRAPPPARALSRSRGPAWARPSRSRAPAPRRARAAPGARRCSP